jgi:hypothetical protein
MIEDHIKLLKKEREQRVKSKETASLRQVAQLRELCGTNIEAVMLSCEIKKTGPFLTLPN